MKFWNAIQRLKKKILTTRSKELTVVVGVDQMTWLDWMRSLKSDVRGLWRWMCVTIRLVKFTDWFPVFWLLSCILIADCFAILSVLPFWRRSHFSYVRSFWMRSHFECVVILIAFSFWQCMTKHSAIKIQDNSQNTQNPLDKFWHTSSAIEVSCYKHSHGQWNISF